MKKKDEIPPDWAIDSSEISNGEEFLKQLNKLK